MLAAAAEPSVTQILGDARVLVAVDLIGVFVFAISGAVLAVRKSLDIFGIAALAFAAGLGGGIIRDVLIEDVPPVALTDGRYTIAALTAAALVFVSHRQLERLGPAVRIFDAIGLAFFAVAGTSKALDAGLPGWAAVGIGLVTAVGGGVLRDVLAGEVPLVLRREIYAVAALLGGVLVALAYELDLYGPVPAAGAVLVAFLVRFVAVRRNWNAPTARTNAD